MRDPAETPSPTLPTPEAPAATPEPPGDQRRPRRLRWERPAFVEVGIEPEVPAGRPPSPAP